MFNQHLVGHRHGVQFDGGFIIPQGHERVRIRNNKHELEGEPQDDCNLSSMSSVREKQASQCRLDTSTTTKYEQMVSHWPCAVICTGRNLGESAQIHLIGSIERIGILEAFHSFTLHRTGNQCNFYILKLLREVRTLGAYTFQCKRLCAPPR